MKPSAIQYAACLALCAMLSACGGGGDSPITGTKDPVVTKPDYNATITAYLTEITNSQNAASQSLSAGGVSSAPAPAAASWTPASPSSTASQDSAAACTFDATNVRWNCPSVTAPNGLVTTAYFQLLDATNTPQTAFDTLTTVAIRRVTDKKGTVTQPLITQTGPVPSVNTVNNHDDLKLTGIRTAAAHRLNGTGSMSISFVPEGRPKGTSSATTATADLGFTAGKPYPTSGKLSAVVVSTTEGQNGSTTNQTTTYDGTAVATLVITFASGQKRTCTYDMTAPTTPATCVGP